MGLCWDERVLKVVLDDLMGVIGFNRDVWCFEGEVESIKISFEEKYGCVLVVLVEE